MPPVFIAPLVYQVSRPCLSKLVVGSQPTEQMPLASQAQVLRCIECGVQRAGFSGCWHTTRTIRLPICGAFRNHEKEISVEVLWKVIHRFVVRGDHIERYPRSRLIANCGRDWVQPLLCKPIARW